MRVNGRVLWLWCWFGVLVASCSQQQTVPGPAAQTATLALLGLTQTAITPTPTLWLFPSPTVNGLIAITLAPTPLPMPITAPTCYEMPIGSALCLGMIRNMLGVSAGDVSVRVYLVSSDGRPLAQREAILARVTLPPGEMSPYAVTFDRVPPGAVGPVAVLINAQEAQAQRMAAIDTRDLSIAPVEGYFRISGALVNTGPSRLDRLTLVVTLFDERDRVVGFRQASLPGSTKLDPDQRYDFTLDVIPIIPQRPLGIRFEVGVDTYLN